MTTSRLPWERMLLAVALVVGVLTMHATPEMCGSSDPPSAVSVAVPTEPAHVPAADHGDGHDCSNHHLLTVCLAILIAAVLLAAAPWRLRILVGATQDGPRRTTGRRLRTGLSPPPAAVRLTELCVSRR